MNVVLIRKSFANVYAFFSKCWNEWVGSCFQIPLLIWLFFKFEYEFEYSKVLVRKMILPI